MDNNKSFNDRLVPISKVVNAAMIDSYANVGASKELFSHFASRGVKKLQREALHVGKRKVLLTVNHSTKTATLPPDCEEETFVGYIDNNGYRVALAKNTNLTNTFSTEEIECVDTCPKCQQDTGICNDLEVTEEEEVVIVNQGSYTKTTVKKLYPNGDYFLEVTTPYYNYVTETVEYVTTKEFIVALDLKPCGCLDTSTENIEKIRTCNSDVYDCYFSGCSPTCDYSIGGYRMFPESGLIQLDYKYKYDKVYIEYNGYMPKVKGQYVIPEVAFETLVEWIKFKAVEGKSSVPNYEKIFRAERYKIEKGNMEKIMGRVSLASIIKIINQTPKFDIDLGYSPTQCGGTSNPYVSQITSSTVSESCAASISCSTGNSNTSNLTPFQLAVIAGQGGGTPVAGEYTYTNLGLVGALNVNSIIVNNNNETGLYGDFTFDSATGTLTRINPWMVGDVLIIGFAKLV